MKQSKKTASKRKRVVGFSVDAELHAKIKAYAEENKFTESAAMRFMIVSFLRQNVNSSNVESEVSKS